MFLIALLVIKELAADPWETFSRQIYNFKTCLSQVNWTGLHNDKDPNYSYNKLLSEYSRLYDFCFPLKPLKVKNCKRLNSPWITKSLFLFERKTSCTNRIERQRKATVKCLSVDLFVSVVSSHSVLSRTLQALFQLPLAFKAFVLFCFFFPSFYWWLTDRLIGPQGKATVKYKIKGN